MKHALLLFTALLFAPDSHAQASPEFTAPQDLRCEGQKEPLGISAIPPCLSWKLADGGRGAAQSAYQILAASRPDLLSEGKEDLWNSGKVASAASAGLAVMSMTVTRSGSSGGEVGVG